MNGGTIFSIRARRLGVVLCAVLLAAACGGGDDEAAEPAVSTTSTSTTAAPITTAAPATTTSTTTSTTTTSTTTSTTTTLPPLDPACVVDPDVLVGGATDAEVLAVLGDAFTAERDDAVYADFQGFRYSCAGEDIFYGGWVSGEPEGLTFAISREPSFADPQGVGPGTPIAQAVASRGGSATVSLSVNNESREFLDFADGGAVGWIYRAGSPSGTAGDYGDDTSSFRVTGNFVADAVVSEVWFLPQRRADLASAGTPESAGLPVIAVLSELQLGDIACYALAEDAIGGGEVVLSAGFPFCERTDLLDTTVQVLFEPGTISDCESPEPCGEVRVELLAVGAVPLGESWAVAQNADWTITVGHLERWNGVDGGGDVTYHGCSGSVLGDPSASCVTLVGGTVECSSGPCVTTWVNGEFSYSIGDDGSGTQTLVVRDGDEVIVSAPDLVIEESSI